MINFNKYLTFLIILIINRYFIPDNIVSAQNFFERADWEGGFPDGCTTITLGKKASVDGSVMISHTCDSHRTRSWFDIQPAVKYQNKALLMLVKRVNEDSLAMPAYKYTPTGQIPN